MCENRDVIYFLFMWLSAVQNIDVKLKIFM